MNNNLDLLITVVPRITHDSDPSPGVSSVSAAAKSAGFKSLCIDFNHILYKELFYDKDPTLFYELDWWMTESPITSLNLPSKSELSLEGQRALDQIFNLWTNEVKNKNPKFFGMGLFSRNSRKMALLFSRHLRRECPSLPIIIGGAGATPLQSELFKVVDYYVEGEGEQAIVDILRQNTEKHVRSELLNSVENLDDLPWPDYSDYPLHEYQMKGERVRITGSRGCVRRCNFCNVYKIWPNYRYRSGQSLANEIYHQHTSLSSHPTHFIFTDSLINGKPKVLKDMCLGLTELKEKKGLNITFEGQFIASSEKFLSADDYKLLKEAGCKRVHVGIESGSETIRFNMNKKVKDRDLFFTIEHLTKNRISQLWYILLCHPTEDESEFLKTLDLLKKFGHLNTEDYKIQVTLHEYKPLEESDWNRLYGHDLIWIDDKDWVYKKNDSLTKQVRRERLLRTEEVLSTYNYAHWQPSLLQHPQKSLKQIIAEHE